VDTSVWIEYLGKKKSPYGRELEKLIASDIDLATADIIIMEVLQGIKDDKTHNEIKELLLAFPVFSCGGLDACLKSAELYRSCRKRGLTIRRSVDCLLAVTAMENNLRVLHKDRDFDHISKMSPLKIYHPL
jgi:hypothetical protein